MILPEKFFFFSQLQLEDELLDDLDVFWLSTAFPVTWKRMAAASQTTLPWSS